MQKRAKNGKFVKSQPKTEKDMTPPFQGPKTGLRGKPVNNIPRVYQRGDGVFRTAKGTKVAINELVFPHMSKPTKAIFYTDINNNVNELVFPHMSKPTKAIFYTDINNNVYKDVPKGYFVVEGHYDLTMCPSDYYNPYTFGDMKKSEPESSEAKNKILDELVKLRGKKTDEDIPAAKSYSLSELLKKVKPNTEKCNCKCSSDPEQEQTKELLHKAKEQVKGKKVQFVGVLAFGYDNIEDFLVNFSADYALYGGQIMLQTIAKHT